MREWQVKRRERTRQLIELGGLVVKAGLVELADDDRATLYGAFLTVAAKLRGEEREQALVLWKRKGKRAFETKMAIERMMGYSHRPTIRQPRFDQLDVIASFVTGL
ncbi:MAG: conjugal transfer protein TraD [Sphingomonadales bacterium]|nr:conjugal transfer protein TraD [Sphingomonadales bacterium]